MAKKNDQERENSYSLKTEAFSTERKKYKVILVANNYFVYVTDSGNESKPMTEEFKNIKVGDFVEVKR